MTDNTLKITFDKANDHRDAVRERLRRAEADEIGGTIEQDARFVLDFESFGEVERPMRRSNLELVETIATVQPSISKRLPRPLTATTRTSTETWTNSNHSASSSSSQRE